MVNISRYYLLHKGLLTIQAAKNELFDTVNFPAQEVFKGRMVGHVARAIERFNRYKWKGVMIGPRICFILMNRKRDREK